MLTKFFINECLNELGQGLNRDIVEEVKLIKAKLALLEVDSPEAKNLTQTWKMLNKERIRALGMELVKGGKY